MKARVVSEFALAMPSYAYIRPGEEFDPEVELLPADALRRLVDRGAVVIVDGEDD